MKDLLNKLTNELSLMTKKNEYYMSVYHPILDQNRDDTKTYIKSLVSEALRNHSELKNKTRLHNNILDKIFEKLDSGMGTKLDSGIGIFIKFNSRKQQKGRLDEIEDENIEIISFSRKPKKEISIGNIYNLGQLIWMENVSREALVLNLDEKECNIYEVEGNGIEKLYSLENSFVSKEKQPSRVYTTGGMIATGHGTGSNIKERSEEESLKLLLRESLDYITSKDFPMQQYEYLVLLYSEPYTPFVEQILKEYSSLREFSALLLSKNIDNPNEILESVREELKENKKAVGKDMLEIAKENYYYYTEGWNEIFKAVNMGQVSTLFIKPGLQREGYLDIQTKLLYTYARKGTRKVEDIVPWLIKSVREKSGVLSVLRGDRYLNSPEVAAQLRYALKRPYRNNKEAIKSWVKRRDGKPAVVSGTEDLLRIKFSDDEDGLSEIGWDVFFRILNDNNLLFIYDRDQGSRFCTFVNKNKENRG